MGLYAVTYQYSEVPGLVESIRPTHREWLKAHFDRGIVAASGPLGEGGAPGALIIIRAETLADAAAIMSGDPMYIEGAVVHRDVRGWTQVFGPLDKE
jgi:uncharacterized protein YciI